MSRGTHRRRAPALVVNPTVQLRCTADVSVRGRRRAVVDVDVQALRALFAAGRTGAGRLGVPLRRQLETNGLLVRPSQIPGPVDLDPRVPALGRVERVLVPRWARARTRLHRGPAAPEGVDVGSQSSEPFLPARNVLWLRQSPGDCELPFTLDRPLAKRVEALARTGEAALPHDAVELLRDTGLLDTAEERRARRARWLEQLDRWQRELSNRRAAVLRRTWPAAFVDAVQRYYAALDAEGYVLGGEARRRGEPLVGNEPVMQFLGAQLAPLVARITGDRAAFTFAYLRIFDPGASLDRHLDRPVCRWTLDLVVGGDPTPTARAAWPLWFEGPRGRFAVRLGVGDAVLYRGAGVEHWRGRQRRHHTTALVSFHFGAAAR